MKKERLLGVFGLDSDAYYNSTSYAPLVTALNNNWDETSYLLERRHVASSLVNKTLAFPSYVGQQIFESTELRRPYFNNCWNTRIQAFSPTYTVAGKTMFSNTNCFLMPYMRSAAPADASPRSQLVRHYDAEARPAQRAAWATMQPRYEGDVNLFVFLAELKDFKSLAKIMLNKPLLSLSNHFRKLLWKARHIDKHRINFDPSKPLAQLHLTNEFAIKPLLADIMAIACQMEVLAADAQQQFSDAGREFSSRHYTEELFREDLDTRSAYSQSKSPWYLSGTSKTLTFTATMEYSYEYNLRSSLSAFMRYWGLVPNAEAVWNLIPFSFLFDYFIKVGRSLRAARRDENVCLNLSQYCESLLSNSSSGLHFKDAYLLHPVIYEWNVNSPDPILGTRHNNLIAGYISSLYTRRVATPNKGAVLPRIARPSSSQRLNMLALARCFL